MKSRLTSGVSEQQQWVDIFKFISKQNGCLGRCTVSNCLSREGVLIQSFSTEEVLKLLDLKGMSRAAVVRHRLFCEIKSRRNSMAGQTGL